MKNFSFSIVDVLNEKLVLSHNEPVLVPIGKGTNAFILDFCLSSVGLETPCLTDIAFGRLKVEDTISKKKIFLNLKMVNGKLDNRDLKQAYTSGMSTAEVKVLETLMADSKKYISDPVASRVDGLYVKQ